MAFHDTLTGIPNRKLFSDRLDIALALSRRNRKPVGIAMLDLDNFKDVNDTCGHETGDTLLKATADRLRAALRLSDTVARLGGDEFARKIVAVFTEPFAVGIHRLVVTTSLGIAFHPVDGTDELTLLKHADLAMYQAKQAGRSCYRLYDKAMP